MALAPDDHKYVVYKTEDLDEWVDKHTIALDVPVVLDAVVIRRQDLFAGPALDAYASSISIAAKLLSASDPVQAAELQKVADYFYEQAQAAHEEGYKIPD